VRLCFILLTAVLVVDDIHYNIGQDIDTELRALLQVKMNDMLGGILTYKLKVWKLEEILLISCTNCMVTLWQWVIDQHRLVQGEDVIRESGVPFAVVRPTALTEEDAGAEVVVDQGDVLKVGSHKGGSAWRARCLQRPGLLCNEIAVY
jgi:hypothetical protein